eukprot:6651380-Pyramimonas_sp.AAC.1
MLIYGNGGAISFQRPRHLLATAAGQRTATPMAATPGTSQTSATMLDTGLPNSPACRHQDAARGSWARRRFAGDTFHSRLLEATRITRRRIMAVTVY